MYINYKFLQVLLTIVLSTLSTPRLWDLLIALNRIETKIEKAKGKKTTKIVQQSATMTHRTRYELSYVTCQKILLVFFFVVFLASLSLITPWITIRFFLFLSTRPSSIIEV